MSKIFTLNEVKGELIIKSTLHKYHNFIVILDKSTVLGKVGINKGDWL